MAQAFLEFLIFYPKPFYFILAGRSNHASEVFLEELLCGQHFEGKKMGLADNVGTVL